MRSLPTPLHALLYDAASEIGPELSSHLDEVLARLTGSDSVHDTATTLTATLAWAATLAELAAADERSYPLPLLRDALELVGVAGGFAHRESCSALSASAERVPHVLALAAGASTDRWCGECDLRAETLAASRASLRVAAGVGELAALLTATGALLAATAAFRRDAPPAPSATPRTEARRHLVGLVRSLASLLDPTPSPLLRARVLSAGRRVLQDVCDAHWEIEYDLARLCELRPQRLRELRAAAEGGGELAEARACLLPRPRPGQDPLVGFLALTLPVLATRGSHHVLLAPAELVPVLTRLGAELAPAPPLPVLETALALCDRDTPFAHACELAGAALARVSPS